VTIQQRDIVVRRKDADRGYPHGTVVTTLRIEAAWLEGLENTPVEAGEYAVVSWNNRRRLRAEPVGDLEKVGEAPPPISGR
jgi:hypothetical protein